MHRKRSSRNIPANSSSGIWQYQDNGRWMTMVPAAINMLENAHSGGLPSLRLTILGRSYSFDLRSLTQTNEHTGFVRPIQRVVVQNVDEGEQDESEEIAIADVDEVKDSEIWVPVELNSEQMKSSSCGLCLGDFAAGECIGRLRKCNGHFFHADCGLAMTAAQYALDKKRCPTCGEFYGRVVGNCPPGKMHVHRRAARVPGFNCSHVWEIIWNFPGGTQNSTHPHPGSPYHSESRMAYLPDTQEGRGVLELFKQGWKQKLLYTVGYSQTRQKDGVIIYNGIHMKTSPAGGSHGYPDPGYLDRVTEEFLAKGISLKSAGESA